MVLVIGATNPVGRATVEALGRAGLATRVVEPDASVASGSAARGSVSHLDLTDRRTWREALDGADRLLITWAPQGHDAGTQLDEFLERSVGDGVSRVVCVSPAGAGTGAPFHRMEETVERAGVRCVVLRNSPCFQNLSDRFARPVAEHDQLRLPVGRGRLAMVDALDVAEVAMGALDGSLENTFEPGSVSGEGSTARTVHTLDGEEALTGEEIAEILTRALGRPIEFHPVSFRQYRRELVASGEPLADVHVRLLENAASRLSLAGHTSATLRELLGRPPRTLEAYVRSHRHDWDPPAASS